MAYIIIYQVKNKIIPMAINSYPFPFFFLFSIVSLSPISSFPFPSFTSFTSYPSPFLPRTTLHYTRITTHSLTTHTHTTHHTQTTHKGTPLSFPLFFFPFVCGVGVVRGMSLGYEWMFCGAGCGVVRVPFPLFFFPSSLFFSLVGVCVGALGGLGVCVGGLGGLGVGVGGLGGWGVGVGGLGGLGVCVGGLE